MTRTMKQLISGYLIAICVVGTAFLLFRDRFNNDFKNAPDHIGACHDPSVAAVIYSIQQNPASWDMDRYSMWHSDDISVWIANEDYGLSLTIGSKTASTNDYQMSDECRSMLFDTINEWKTDYVNSKLRR